jgi:hypothetical protein
VVGIGAVLLPAEACEAPDRLHIADAFIACGFWLASNYLLVLLGPIDAAPGNQPRLDGANRFRVVQGIVCMPTNDCELVVLYDDQPNVDVWRIVCPVSQVLWREPKSGRRFFQSDSAQRVEFGLVGALDETAAEQKVTSDPSLAAGGSQKSQRANRHYGDRAHRLNASPEFNARRLQKLHR